ncbi:MAG: hypothetical protein KGM24_12385 [Elusimicrobia bacterium]|nr:hypothetical protein [Elusimicrobiota bacterium]
MRRAFLAAVLALSCVPARAAFDDAPFGARDAAMGGAFTAVSGEVGAIAYNPAALGRARSLEAAASYQNGVHWPAGTIDRDVTRAAGAIPIRQDILDGAFGVGVRYDRRTNVAKDREIGLYYGTRGLLESEDRGTLDFGGGLKLLQSSLETGGSTAMKPALDLGALWRPDGRHSVGASLLNFGGASFKDGSYADRAPLALRVGAAESLGGALIDVDGTVREPSSGQGRSVDFAAGFERWWATAEHGSFAGRSGLLVGDLSRDWSWGFGWRRDGARIDYAMTVPLTGVTRFGHSLTLSIRFGGSDPEAEYARMLAGEIEARRELGRSLDASRVRQEALSAEISRLEGEVAALKQSLAIKGVSESAARRQLDALEARQKKAAETLRKLKAEQAREASMTKAELFREDWAAYQKTKLDGAPDAVLLARLQRLLLEYKGTGADLGEANRELIRLQGSR